MNQPPLMHFNVDYKPPPSHCLNNSPVYLPLVFKLILGMWNKRQNKSAIDVIHQLKHLVTAFCSTKQVACISHLIIQWHKSTAHHAVYQGADTDLRNVYIYTSPPHKSAVSTSLTSQSVCRKDSKATSQSCLLLLVSSWCHSHGGSQHTIKTPL